MVEIEDAGQGLDMERPSLEPFDPIPEWLLPYRRLGVHLGAQNVAARIERPVANSRLFRKVQCRANTEISPAPTIDEVVHHLRGVAAADFLAVILEVMRIPGHGNPDVVARQKAIERGTISRGIGDIMVFSSRGKIPPAGEAWMAHDGHDKLTAASAESAFDPCQLFFVDRAQDAGIDRQQREILGLQLEERRPLGADVDAVLLT